MKFFNENQRLPTIIAPKWKTDKDEICKTLINFHFVTVTDRNLQVGQKCM